MDNCMTKNTESVIVAFFVVVMIALVRYKDCTGGKYPWGK